METPLCQPAVALRSRYNDGLGWGFFWFVVAVLTFIGIISFLVYRFWWIPRKAAQEQMDRSLPYRDWRPSTLKWSDMDHGRTMQTTGIAPGYSIPKTTSIPITRISSQPQSSSYLSQPPPVVVIPPEMDFTKSPSPHPMVPFSPQGQYRVQYNELSPYSTSAGERRVVSSSADPPQPYEALAVRTTTTTRRTTVLSPISHSHVTTIV